MGRRDRATLATPEKIAEAKVDLRLGVRAVSLDVESVTVELASGSRVEGTHVVIATGARARRLPYSADADIYTLRSRDDEARLRPVTEGEPGNRIAVIGGGFIGAEVATAAQGTRLRADRPRSPGAPAHRGPRTGRLVVARATAR